MLSRIAGRECSARAAASRQHGFRGRAWLGLQVEAAANDLLYDLGGAADDRHDVTEPPALTIATESGGLVVPPVKAGSI